MLPENCTLEVRAPPQRLAKTRAATPKMPDDGRIHCVVAFPCTDIKNGDREGSGLYHYTSGDLLITRWRSNEPVGEGVHWNADRSRAMLVRNGVSTGDISQAEAESIARRLRQPAGRRMHASKPISWGLATTHAVHAPSHNAVSGDFTQGDYLMAAKARWKTEQQNQSPGSKAGTPRTGVRV